MAISVIATGVIPGSTFAASKSVSINFGTGDNRAVMMFGFIDAAGSTTTIDSADINGVAMTAGVAGGRFNNANIKQRAFYLAGASVPSGTQTITLTCNNSSRKPGAYIVVLQGDAGATLSFANETVTGASSLTPSVTLTTVAGDLALALTRKDASNATNGTGTGGTTCAVRESITSYDSDYWTETATGTSTTMNVTYGGTTPGVDIVAVAVTSSSPASASFNITTEDSVFSGSAGPGSSTSCSFSLTTDAAEFTGSAYPTPASGCSFALTTDAAVFSGSAGINPGTITGAPITNASGGLLSSTLIPVVAFYKRADMSAAALILTNQTTDGAGMLPVTNAALSPGNTYLRVLAGVDLGASTDVGCKAYVATS